jgi:prolyl-tRNA editing enzyme YbaK/EbsC (Cys-tRNA(Pro) deacylase)
MMHIMDIKLGTLEFSPALTRHDLLATPVRAALESLEAAGSVGVAAIDGALSDTAAFCEAYEVGMDQAANCVVLEAKQGTERAYAACVVLATTRADVNGLIKKTLQVRKVSFANMELATGMTEMEYGAITPIGLPNDWPIFIDRRVAMSDRVIIGSGLRGSKLAVTGAFLAALPNARVLDDLGLDKTVYGNS